MQVIYYKSTYLQEVADVLKLRDVVFGVTAVLFQEREDVSVLLARVSGEQFFQFAVHCAPGSLFSVVVLDSRDLRASSVLTSNSSDLLTSTAIVLVLYIKIREVFVYRLSHNEIQRCVSCFILVSPRNLKYYVDQVK